MEQLAIQLLRSGDEVRTVAGSAHGRDLRRRYGLSGEELRAALSRNFQAVYLASAEQILNAQPIGVDWGIVNQNAASWARQSSFELVSRLTDTSRKLLQDSVARFFEEQMTIGDLRRLLTPTFGPVRASLIASTEVTRAAVQGEMDFVRLLGDQGAPMVAIWQTSADELVCPICSPRNQRRRGDGWTEPPPAHPRCRCWVNHEFVEVPVA